MSSVELFEHQKENRVSVAVLTEMRKSLGIFRELRNKRNQNFLTTAVEETDTYSASQRGHDLNRRYGRIHCC